MHFLYRIFLSINRVRFQQSYCHHLFPSIIHFRLRLFTLIVHFEFHLFPSSTDIHFNFPNSISLISDFVSFLQSTTYTAVIITVSFFLSISRIHFQRSHFSHSLPTSYLSFNHSLPTSCHAMDQSRSGPTTKNYTNVQKYLVILQRLEVFLFFTIVNYFRCSASRTHDLSKTLRIPIIPKYLKFTVLL